MNPDIKTTESTSIKKYIINFSVFLIILITVYFVMAAFAQNRLYSTATSEDAIIITNSEIKSGDVDFSYKVKSKDDSIKTVFTADINKKEIVKLDEQYLTVFLPNMLCEAFEIYINGKSIAVEGDIVNYNSNVWTKNYSYTIESSLFDRDVSELKIVQYSRYLRGGLANPFIIDGYEHSLRLKDYKSFDIRHGIFGISMFSLLLVLLMIFLFKEKRAKYYIILVSLIFMMIGYSEYFELSYLPFSFLAYKKITVSSNFIAAGIGTVFYRTLFKKKKYNWLFISIYSAVIIAPALFVKDMVTYKSVYSTLTYATAPLLIYWIYISAKNLKKYTRARTMITLAITSIAYIIAWIISEIMQTIYMDTVTVVTMPSFIIAALAIIFIDMHQLRVNIAASQRKSMLDGLTGLYNVEFIKGYIKDLDTPFTFAVCDIDDFKNINDSLGHLAGDKALIHLSNTISNLLREGDVLGRYGGDEFILILQQDSSDTANSILERIRKEVEKSEIEYQGNTKKITISLGYYISHEKESYESMLEKADAALYIAKKFGKNTTTKYDPISNKI